MGLPHRPHRVRQHLIGAVVAALGLWPASVPAEMRVRDHVVDQRGYEQMRIDVDGLRPGQRVTVSGAVTAAQRERGDGRGRVTMRAGVAARGCGASSILVRSRRSRVQLRPPEPRWVRAAFYYPWFPEAWRQQGLDPFTRFRPLEGFYDGGDPRLLRRHVRAMRRARLQAGIASWWGPGSREDRRIPALLAAAGSTAFRWSLYYEAEGQGDPSPSQISADLRYLRERYGSHRSALCRRGRFVIFVYAQPEDGAEMAARWAEADTRGVHVVLKVFPGYRAIPSRPAGWHQYAPAVAEDHQRGHSFSLSPGFWKANEPASRLVRDLERFRSGAARMVISREPWQLLTTFNEWGEGTAIEAAREWGNAYLTALAAARAPR